jgi:hypothetical protein
MWDQSFNSSSIIGYNMKKLPRTFFLPIYWMFNFSTKQQKPALLPEPAMLCAA